MFCAKLGWHWLVRSGEKSSIYVHYVAMISLWQIESSSPGGHYVKCGRAWRGFSEEINVRKYMDGHLERQADKQTDRQ